jgi:hypothetical protein
MTATIIWRIIRALARGGGNGMTEIIHQATDAIKQTMRSVIKKPIMGTPQVE